jgi:hypothetical protein
MTNKTKESATPAVDFLRCQQWVGQLSLKDALMMEDTKEFQDFMHAFRCLEGAHRQSLSSSTNNYVNLHQQQADNDDPPAISLLQSMMAEDIVLRVLDFLDSQSLVRASQTCQRLLDLTNRNARQRSSDLVEARQLSSPLQLLRAKEQIQGIGLSPHDPYVRLPSLLLRRRIVVTDCGDPEYNGVYYCTSYSGIGFIFTKPRIPIQRVIRPVSQLLASDDVSEAPSMINGESACHHEDLPLRCILEKRFSNEVTARILSDDRNRMSYGATHNSPSRFFL